MQRQSNNFRPQFTDEECITVYLWGISQRRFEQKAIYNYTKNHLSEWFPKLPRYQAFSRRCTALAPAFRALAERWMEQAAPSGEARTIYMVDSCPIMLESHRSVYDYVVYDSDVERGFAEELENNESVKVYAKLPAWFKVPTPLGSYNPDWAVVIEDDGLNKLYFVVETKGSIEGKDLRPKEQAKIRCGEKHFAALGNEATFMKADSFQRFTEHAI